MFLIECENYRYIDYSERYFGNKMKNYLIQIYRQPTTQSLSSESSSEEDQVPIINTNINIFNEHLISHRKTATKRRMKFRESFWNIN